MSNITFDMPIDRTVTVITDGRNITNIVFDMNIPDRPDPICEKAKEQFLAYFDGRLKEFSLRFGAEKKSAPDTDTVSQDSPCKRRHRLLYGYAGDRY